MVSPSPTITSETPIRKSDAWSLAVPDQGQPSVLEGPPQEFHYRLYGDHRDPQHGPAGLVQVAQERQGLEREQRRAAAPDHLKREYGRPRRRPRNLPPFRGLAACRGREPPHRGYYVGPAYPVSRHAHRRQCNNHSQAVGDHRAAHLEVAGHLEVLQVPSGPGKNPVDDDHY